MTTLNGFEVDVDARNPGQFLACCGLLEVADRLWGAEAWFESGSFKVTTAGSLEALVAALIAYEPQPEPAASMAGHAVDVKPLIEPLRVTFSAHHRGSIRLDSWLRLRPDRNQVASLGNPPWNFWSGQQTSLGIWNTLAASLRQLDVSAAGRRLFTMRSALSGRFGFDPGAAWNALDVGFSPNEQSMAVASSPAVELLAAVGIQRFRPEVNAESDTFKYATWGKPLPPIAAAVAARGLVTVGGSQQFVGRVVSRGSYAALGFSTVEKGFRS